MTRMEQMLGCLGHKGNKPLYCAEDLGFDEIGRGATRTVYRYGKSNRVFKIGDRECNRTEAYLYNCAPPSLRSMLAKVIGISRCGRVLEMEYIPLPLYCSTGDVWSVSKKLMRHIRARKLHSLLSSDIHYGNVGLKSNGEIKILDYGYLTGDCIPLTKAEVVKNLKRRKPIKDSKAITVGRGVYRELYSKRKAWRK